MVRGGVDPPTFCFSGQPRQALCRPAKTDVTDNRNRARRKVQKPATPVIAVPWAFTDDLLSLLHPPAQAPRRAALSGDGRPGEPGVTARTAQPTRQTRREVATRVGNSRAGGPHEDRGLLFLGRHGPVSPGLCVRPDQLDRDDLLPVMRSNGVPDGHVACGQVQFVGPRAAGHPSGRGPRASAPTRPAGGRWRAARSTATARGVPRPPARMIRKSERHGHSLLPHASASWSRVNVRASPAGPGSA